MNTSQSTEKLPCTPQTAPKHSRSSLGWAGGFLDGEGLIRIDKSCWENDKASTSRYVLEVSFVQATRRNLDHLRDLLGVSGHLAVRHGLRPQAQQFFQLCYRGAWAGEVLELVQPYLTGKRSQAAVALEFLEKTGCVRGASQPFKPATPSVQALCEVYCLRLESLRLAA